ncbi:MAG: helix-turn-helix transcriptional regulator [Gammaproteobacteria bacterium]
MLTESEKRIGYLLLQGNNAKEIAKKLGISFYTVETHQRSIKKKLNCKNTYQIGHRLSAIVVA